MIVTVFRSRLRPENVEEYYQWAARISALAKTMPGYVSHKAFTADDGERVTIVEFESDEAQRAWARQADHVEAKKRGRASFYSEYRIQVCTVTRELSFHAEPAAPEKAGTSS
ncbi:MAG TPA: antibiotic biosynthesis monooxygenase [Usitatibacter sp.]|nr:antibiotic biosynthesis monooxygenase [Usitatibacter sp.]